MDTKIIKKIKKLLALSESSNENESQNAMMKVQELLMKHKLSLTEVEKFEDDEVQVNEKITEFTFTKAKWKCELAILIAENLGCYCYLRRYRTNTIVFMGKGEDVIICDITLKYALDFINEKVKKIKREYTKKGYSVRGIESDYALGFVRGLKQRYEEQKEKHKEWGLILTKDLKVIETYKNLEFGGQLKANSKFSYHTNVYKKGIQDGKNFSIVDKVANEDESNKLLLK